jgi:hypothetical protein
MKTAKITQACRAICWLTAFAAVWSVRVTGQAPAKATRAATPAVRTAGGHPDLSGLYNAATVTPLERPDVFKGKTTATEAEAAKYAKDFLDAGNIDRRDPDPRVDVGRAYENVFLDRGTGMARLRGMIPTSLVVDPPDGKIPAMTAEGEKRVSAERAQNRPTSEAGEQSGASGAGAYDNPEQRPLAERCLLGFGSTSGPPALPVLYNNFKQIVQTTENVMILNEMVHDVRVVRMNAQHLPPTVRKWMGDSVGRWEGDTLVIDTTNFTEKTSFRGSSKDLHVVERLSRMDAGTVLYRFTVDDPATWTRPWTAEYPWVATADQLYEYACHENNYALGNILSGARFFEKDAAQKSNR